MKRKKPWIEFGHHKGHEFVYYMHHPSEKKLVQQADMTGMDWLYAKIMFFSQFPNSVSIRTKDGKALVTVENMLANIQRTIEGNKGAANEKTKNAKRLSPSADS